jgi:hypothetical protein
MKLARSAAEESLVTRVNTDSFDRPLREHSGT